MSASPTSSRDEVSYLTISDVKDVVYTTVLRSNTSTEPMPEFDTVDMPKLEAALQAPQRYAFGMDFYREIHDKAAILLYSLAKAHAWTNGNKRMAFMSTLIFLGANNYWWDADGGEMYITVSWTAGSEARASKQVVDYLRKYFKHRVVPFPEQVESEDNA